MEINMRRVAPEHVRAGAGDPHKGSDSPLHHEMDSNEKSRRRIRTRAIGVMRTQLLRALGPRNAFWVQLTVGVVLAFLVLFCLGLGVYYMYHESRGFRRMPEVLDPWWCWWLRDACVDEVYVRGRHHHHTLTAPERRPEPLPPPGGRRVSGVILMLAGWDKPKHRVDLQSSLQLLDRNFLRHYPHYPVHIFHELLRNTASAAVEGLATDLFELADPERHPLALYSFSPSEEARKPDVRTGEASTPTGAFHRFARAIARFVPSAPRVFLEDVSPIFTALPPNVKNELLIERWVDGHRPDEPLYELRRMKKGYRQMCRFWFGLFYNLPSLLVPIDADKPNADGKEGGIVIKGRRYRYKYDYYWRLDSDSFIKTKVGCDVFLRMAANGCQYGFNSVVRENVHSIVGLTAAVGQWFDWHDPTPFFAASGAATAGSPLARDENYPRESWGPVSAEEKEGFLQRFTVPSTEGTGFCRIEPPHTSRLVCGGGRRGTYLGSSAGTKKFHTDYTFLTGNASTQYNLFAYYNNFEMGTFRLRGHPLCRSLFHYLDAVHFTPANASYPADSVAEGGNGFMRFRWGDAPLHTFCVELALAREDGKVCRFNERIGGYRHSYLYL